MSSPFNCALEILFLANLLIGYYICIDSFQACYNMTVDVKQMFVILAFLYMFCGIVKIWKPCIQENQLHLIQYSHFVGVLFCKLHIESCLFGQTAERVLETTCGSTLTATFLGNAPCGFYRYNFPAPVRLQTGCAGAKVCFSAQ